jgi:hypothetical protein
LDKAEIEELVELALVGLAKLASGERVKMRTLVPPDIWEACGNREKRAAGKRFKAMMQEDPRVAADGPNTANHQHYIKL